jgi:hypothetical protein
VNHFSTHGSYILALVSSILIFLLSPPSKPSTIRLGVLILDLQPAVVGVILCLPPPTCLGLLFDAALNFCLLSLDREAVYLLAGFNPRFCANLEAVVYFTFLPVFLPIAVI